VAKSGRLWIPVDVDFLEHNRWGFDEVEMVTYLRLVGFCKRTRSDGLMPLRTARRIAGDFLDELVNLELVRITETYAEVCDYLAWNLSRQQVDKIRADTRERVRQHRERRKQQDHPADNALGIEELQSSETNDVSNAVSNGVTGEGSNGHKPERRGSAAFYAHMRELVAEGKAEEGANE
jgi:hypothetical protein